MTMKIFHHLKQFLFKATKQNEIPHISEPIREHVIIKPVIKPQQPLHRVFVGIDFGTVFTKAAYKGPKDKIFAIQFNHHATDDGFLESIVSRDPNSDVLKIGVASKGGDTYRYSKMLSAAEADPETFKVEIYQDALNSYKGINPGIIAALILGHAIEQAKFLAARDLKALRYTNLEYEIRVCIPIDYLVNNPVREHFERIFALTEHLINTYQEQLSKGLFPVSELEAVKQEFASIRYSQGVCKIQHRPEVVAELQSYALSLKRIIGKPLAVYDIGGGTTEITIFKSLMDSSFNIYSTHIIPLGAIYAGEDRSRVSEITTLAMPEWLRAQKRNKKSQHQAHWAEAEVYLSGGGSHIKHARGAFARSDDRVTGLYNHTYPVRELPTPENFSGPKGSFKRLCVAYGLAIPDEPDYLFPNDIQEHAPLNRRPPCLVRSWV